MTATKSTNEKVFLDSNILIYLAMEQDVRKRKISQQIVNDYFHSITISVQVLGEIYWVLDRKSDLEKKRVADLTIRYSSELILWIYPENHFC